MPAKVRPANIVEAEQKQIARDLVADVRRLDRAICDNCERCWAAVDASGTTLTTIRGISEVLAAKIIGDIGRFPCSDNLAGYAGIAPTEASSGDVTRHRFSRQGNRHLNKRHPPRRPRPDPPRRTRSRLLPATHRSRQQPHQARRRLKRQITKPSTAASSTAPEIAEPPPNNNGFRNPALAWRRYQATPLRSVTRGETLN